MVTSSSFSSDILVTLIQSLSFFDKHFVQFQLVLYSFVSPYQTLSTYQYVSMIFSTLALVSHLSTLKQIQICQMHSVVSVHLFNPLQCVHQHGFLWAISVDRWFRIRFPFRVRELCTIKRVLLGALFILICAIILNSHFLLPSFGTL